MKQLIGFVMLSLCLAFFSCGDDERELPPLFLGSVPSNNVMDFSPDSIIKLKFNQEIKSENTSAFYVIEQSGSTHVVQSSNPANRDIVAVPVNRIISVVINKKEVLIQADLEGGKEYLLGFPYNCIYGEKTNLPVEPFNIRFGTKKTNP